MQELCRKAEGIFKIRLFFPENAEGVLIAVKPCELPLGIAAAVLLYLVNGGLTAYLTAHCGDSLLVADGLHCGTLGGEPGGEQRFDLLPEPFGHHEVNAAVNAGI